MPIRRQAIIWIYDDQFRDVIGCHLVSIHWHIDDWTNMAANGYGTFSLLKITWHFDSKSLQFISSRKDQSESGNGLELNRLPLDHANIDLNKDCEDIYALLCHLGMMCYDNGSRYYPAAFLYSFIHYHHRKETIDWTTCFNWNHFFQMTFWYVYSENWEQPWSQICPHWDTAVCRYDNVEYHTSDDTAGVMMTLSFLWTDPGSATYVQ